MNKLEPKWSVPAGSDSIVLSSGLTAAEKQVRNTAILVALLIHIALVVVVFPKAPPPEAPKVKTPDIIRVLVKPPERDEVEAVDLIKPKPRIPVPDPDPLDPEPLAVIEPDPGDVPYIERGWIDPGVLEPPEPDRIFNADTWGLVNPVYDMAQLQRNVHYPELGVASRLSGFVVVEMILRADGTVDAAQVIGGDLKPYSWFCNEALRAVRRLEFEPGHFHGRPVDVQMRVTIHFKFR